MATCPECKEDAGVQVESRKENDATVVRFRCQNCEHEWDVSI